MAEVLSVQMPDGQSYFSPSPLRRSSPSQASFLVAPSGTYSPNRQPKYPTTAEHNENGSPLLASSPTTSPSKSTQGESAQEQHVEQGSTSKLTQELQSSDDEEDDGIAFPSYNDVSSFDDDDKTETTCTVVSSGSDSAVSTNTSSTPEPLPVAEDDTAIKQEPSRHVDYLSHDWREEDIWCSWRHITTNRKMYGQRSRLENASWRTWAKAKYRLQTVSPETLNWLKDCDVTWLYGPLQTSSSASLSNPMSESSSHISQRNSFINKKPILKKRSMSEVMLQRSISTSSLVKQAAAAVQAQQDNSSPTVRLRNRPVYARATSDFMSIPSKSTSREATDYFTSHSTSGLSTPGNGEKRHIRFDEKVEQCIAIENKDDNEYESTWAREDDSDDSDDGLEIKTKSRRISRTNSKSNFNLENKTIAKLPDTTLKYRTDSPDVPDQTPAHSLGLWRSSRLSPSPSQETLRPSHPSSNFLLGEDDDDDDDISWEPSGVFAGRRDSIAVTRDHFGGDHNDEESESSSSGGLRRTSSGMFMPYEEDEDDIVAAGLFGKVVDTVNTAKDIAHVIWNVGWRS